MDYLNIPFEQAQLVQRTVVDSMSEEFKFNY